MIRTNLLYNTVIESDGRVHREETFLGAMIAFGAFLIIAACIIAIFL